jgi:hypothetical protein
MAYTARAPIKKAGKIVTFPFARNLADPPGSCNRTQGVPQPHARNQQTPRDRNHAGFRMTCIKVGRALPWLNEPAHQGARAGCHGRAR